MTTQAGRGRVSSTVTKRRTSLEGAFQKGWSAAVAGQPLGACPYKDKRKDCGRLTWSRAFISAWCDGWNASRQADPITAYYADRLNSGNSVLSAHQ